MRLSVRSTIAVRLAYSPRWKFWNVSFGNGNVASRDSDRVSAGPELASDSNTGPSCRSSVTRFAVVLLTESTVRALNLLSCSAASTSVSRSSASTASASGMVARARSKTGCWSANLPTRRLRLSVAAMMSPDWLLRYAVKVSSCPISPRRSCSRPANAVLNASVMS
ncbi:Uncharacterised protein [Mycobacterium tuberculosis]|uniref:Uncharacterized protein n=1 Tax=Mycobacterium tuberculosis TaxID=1773 RepID=A0A654U4G8_MYCTX|nr:Uncharacterised protein [Mycobacterium tuberculosis]